MRVLWLKFGELLPVDTGGKLRSFHLLKELGKLAELTFVSYAPKPLSPDYRRAIAEALPGSVTYDVSDLPQWRRVALRPIVLSATRGIPLNVSRFSSLQARRQLQTLIGQSAFDIGVCDFLTPTWVFPQHPPFPTILFEHNVEWALWDRRTATIPWGPKRVLYRWETSRTRAIERASLARFDTTLAVSDADRDALRAMAPDADVVVLPTGVDVAAFAPTTAVPPQHGLVVFVGSMDWQPNVDGVVWFLEQIWPEVRAAIPGARFRIVGRRPPPEIQGLAGGDIEVTGDVDAVQPHLHQAVVTVVPLRAGGGTRLKIFESMAAGAPVVSTTIGAEGLDVVAGRDLVIADDPQSFAAGVIGLLRDPVMRARFSANGSEAVRESDWSGVAKRLAALMESIVARQRRGR